MKGSERGLPPIKHYQVTKCQVLPHGHVITIWMLGNLFGLITGCQVLCNHVIATYNLPCWPPQKFSGETGRVGCKLLLPVKRTPSCLWGLEVPAVCACLNLSSQNSSMPGPQTPSLHLCRELHEGRRKGHTPPCLPGSQQLKCKHAQSPKPFSLSLHRALQR